MLNTGDKFELLTILPDPPRKASGRQQYLCQCDCGSPPKWIFEDALKNKKRPTRSCGCLRYSTHGCTKNHLYFIWKGMIRRCSSPTYDGYHNYGGRGITVCQEWQKTPNDFILWAEANGYAPGLLLDREQNDGNYEPGNCRWVTRKVSDNNKRSNHLLTAHGATMTIVEWSRDPRCAVSYNTLRLRIYRYHWDDERAITTPPD